MTAVGVGVVGAGVISGQYLETLSGFPDVEVRFVADLDLDRAKVRAEEFGVPAHGSVEELLARDDIEIVVNLTVPAVHVEVGRHAIAAGKHVWSEKPFATDRESGAELLRYAEENGLRVACAPDTFLGAGLQSAQRLIDAGRIGRPLTATAVFQCDGPESWHPDPEFLYLAGAGPLLDLGPYYLTALVQVFGPASRVSAVSSTARTSRVIGSGPRAGTVFPVEVPTYHSALVQFEDGGSATVLFSFDNPVYRASIEVTGVDGTTLLPDPNQFTGPTTVFRRGDPEQEVAEVGSQQGRGIGVLELARAIRAGRPERATGRFAFHVLDIMLSIEESARLGRPVEVASTTARPEPLPSGWDPTQRTLLP
ncbi:Gfo/Idh/MocA family protein [Dactylosporangium siamense]|uniref:Oxidoreductase n=1 Tax=Dactylosporangium siamense TaxID=685454 RepID=A0A919PQQ2_9ACTN|nr:Gfo/Idh/MocA family oxidoreductase [Dactylosporangium siamense]GIG47972.1 oxidoreductase [Dactylosporangium siamense]